MTIKDIARLSGCSVSTISRVINDRPDVRPETKEHVLAIMRQVGFVPNSNARQLKIQQSRSVVFVVKGTHNMFFADLLVHLQQVVGMYGYSGIVSYLDEDADEVAAVEKSSTSARGSEPSRCRPSWPPSSAPTSTSPTCRWWAWTIRLPPIRPSPA